MLRQEPGGRIKPSFLWALSEQAPRLPHARLSKNRMWPTQQNKPLKTSRLCSVSRHGGIQTHPVRISRRIQKLESSTLTLIQLPTLDPSNIGGVSTIGLLQQITIQKKPLLPLQEGETLLLDVSLCEQHSWWQRRDNCCDCCYISRTPEVPPGSPTSSPLYCISVR